MQTVTMQVVRDRIFSTFGSFYIMAAIMDVQREQLEEQQQPSIQQEQDYDDYEDYDDYDDYLDDELNDADWDNATGGEIMRHPSFKRRY